MTSYSLSPQAFNKRRNKLVLQSAGGFPLLIAAEAVLVYSYAGLSSQFWSILAPSVLLGAGVIAVGAYRTLTRQKKIWQTLRVVLGRNYVAIKQEGGGEMRVRRDEVSAIQQTANGLLISTHSQPSALLIPAELEPAALDEITSALEAWSPIQPAPPRRRFTISRNVFLTAVWLAAAITLLAPSLWLIWAALLALVILSGFWAFWLWRQPHGSNAVATRNSLVAIGLLLAIAAIKALAVIGGLERLQSFVGR